MDFFRAMSLLKRGGRVTRDHPSWRNAGAYLFVDKQGNLRMHTTRYGDEKFDYNGYDTSSTDWMADVSTPWYECVIPTEDDVRRWMQRAEDMRRPTGWPYHEAPFGSRIQCNMGQEADQ